MSCNAEFPFEFRALEVALEAICSFLDARTRELEAAAYPALDELTSKVKGLFNDLHIFQINLILLRNLFERWKQKLVLLFSMGCKKDM